MVPESTLEEVFYEKTLRNAQADLAAIDERAQHESANQTRMRILALITRLRRACSHPFLALPKEVREKQNFQNFGSSTKVRRLVSDLLQVPAGEKSIIFSQWKDTLDIVNHYLQEVGNFSAESIVRFDGSVSDSRRRDARWRFDNDPNCRFFLINLHAGGVGLNLVAANHVFIMDPWWNDSVEQQAIDRAYRIGQTQPVHVTRYVVKGTIEENIMSLKKKKLVHVEAGLAKEEAQIGKLNFEDLRLLLEFPSVD
jgi:SNF2 family DNA or RNA helicase